jgi:autotransporter adhesin
MVRVCSIVDRRITAAEKRLNGAVAAATALAQPVFFAKPGTTALAAGVGSSNGQAAVGLSVNHLSRQGGTMYSAGVGVSGNSTLLRAGASWIFN